MDGDRYVKIRTFKMVFMFHLHVAAVLSMLRLSDGLTKTPLLPLPLPSKLARIALSSIKQSVFTPVAFIQDILVEVYL